MLSTSDDDARHLCLIVDGEVSRWQSAEIEQFLRRSLGQDRRVIPVLTRDTPASVLSGSVGNLRYLRIGTLTDDLEIARDLADQLNGGADSDADLRRLLSEIADVTLRPLMWDLVGDILRDLRIATTTDNRQWSRELSDDLAVVIRHRATHQPDQVPAPTELLKSIKIIEQRGFG